MIYNINKYIYIEKHIGSLREKGINITPKIYSHWINFIQLIIFFLNFNFTFKNYLVMVVIKINKQLRFKRYFNFNFTLKK